MAFSVLPSLPEAAERAGILPIDGAWRCWPGGTALAPGPHTGYLGSKFAPEVTVNPGGGSGWDEPPLDIQIPDDARELDREVLAYHRELRAKRRRDRLRRLAGPLAGRATVMPLLASILAVCLVAGAMLSVATFRPATTPAKQTPRPPTAAAADRPAPPRSSTTARPTVASASGTSASRTGASGTGASGTSASGTSASATSRASRSATPSASSTRPNRAGRPAG